MANNGTVSSLLQLITSTRPTKRRTRNVTTTRSWASPTKMANGASRTLTAAEATSGWWPTPYPSSASLTDPTFSSKLGSRPPASVPHGRHEIGWFYQRPKGCRPEKEAFENWERRKIEMDDIGQLTGFGQYTYERKIPKKRSLRDIYFWQDVDQIDGNVAPNVFGSFITSLGRYWRPLSLQNRLIVILAEGAVDPFNRPRIG